MFLDTRDFEDTARLNPVGERETGFVENTVAAFDAFQATDRFVSEQANFITATAAYLDQVFDATGRRFANPETALIGGVAGLEPPEGLGAFRAEQRAELFVQLSALHAEDPSFPLKTEADLKKDAVIEALRLTAVNKEVGAQATGLGQVGQFVGAAGAVFTDPPILISLLVGAPVAASVARTAVIEGLIGGVSEAAIQPKVQKFRAQLGLPAGFKQAAANVALAAGGGGVGAAGFKLLGLGFKRLLKIGDEVGAFKTEGQRDAAQMLRRQVELEDESPLPRTAANDDIHARDYETAVAEARNGKTVAEDVIPNRVAAAAKTIELPRKSKPPAREINPILRDIADDLPDGGDVPSAPPRAGPLEQGQVDPGQVDPGQVDPGLAAQLAQIRPGGPPPPRPMSLLKFLKAAGGLRETDSFRGELRGIGLSPRTLPGIINNKTGLDLDEAALRATEQGFFPERERASPDELLAALDEEINLGRPLFSVVEDDLVFELRALEELAETLDRFEIDVRLPDAAIERQLRALAQGFDELLAPGGQEVSRTLSDITREAEAMRAAGAVEDLADDADVIAALSQDLERLLARQKDFSIPVGVELDPRTGELVTVTRRLSAVIEDLDADDAFNVQLKECAGL